MNNPNLIIEIVLGIFALLGTAAFLFTRRRLNAQIVDNRHHEAEMAKKVYEKEVLHEISERTGYSLDPVKIIEIISGSVGNLLPYSTVSYMIAGHGDAITFSCRVNEPVAKVFIRDVKVKMLSAFSRIMEKPLVETDVDDAVSGVILDEKAAGDIRSFFNIPIIIAGRAIGIINVATAANGVVYGADNTEVFYSISRQAGEAVFKLNEVLEMEKAKLLRAVESLADGILMVDTNYQLVLVNRKLTEILGTISKPTLFDIINALSGKFDLRGKMEAAVNHQMPTVAEEIAIRDRAFQILVSRVMDRDNKKTLGIVVLFHDITDSKSIEKLRREFTAMMVHELRSPITSIKATVEMVQDDMTKMNADEIRRNLALIDSTSGAMLEVVNDLLDVAKLEAGKFDVVCDSAKVADPVSERVESVRAMAQEKNLKLTCSIEENLPDGYFDKIRIKQVMNNLLSNALKFTDRGEISVTIKKEVVGGLPVDILVSIKDTGIGIEPDQINGLFSKFKQLRAGRNNAGLKSSGLGLFIAKGIVSAWGGKIWGESQGTGMGSVFHFTIPIAQDDKPRAEEDIASVARQTENINRPTVSINKVAQA